MLIKVLVCYRLVWRKLDALEAGPDGGYTSIINYSELGGFLLKEFRNISEETEMNKG